MTEDEKREVLRQARANVARHVPREDIPERREAATKTAPERSEDPSVAIPHLDDPVRLKRDWQQREVEPEPASKEDVMDVLGAVEALCQAVERQQDQIDDLERAVDHLKQQSIDALSEDIKRMLNEFGQDLCRKLDALDELLTRSAADRAKVLDLPPLPLARQVN